MTRLIMYALAALLVLGSSSLYGQTSSACRSSDSTSIRMVEWVTNVVTGTDSGSVRQRTQMKLPNVAASKIAYVTDTKVCTKLLSPYNANSALTDSGAPVSPSGNLYVIKVGNVYVASDPAKHWGDFMLLMTLDSKFRFLARSLG
jgi:hypothetical protein